MSTTTLTESTTARLDADTQERQRAVAQTILQQLGGKRFIAMTGARDLYSDATGLRFALPARFARDGINRIHIALTDLDLYTLTAHRVRGRTGAMPTVTQCAEETHIHVEQLVATFERVTGLTTRL